MIPSFTHDHTEISFLAHNPVLPEGIHALFTLLGPADHRGGCITVRAMKAVLEAYLL